LVVLRLVAFPFSRTGTDQGVVAGPGRGMDIRNDTAINVAGLLQEPFGSTRHYRLLLDRFPLGGGLTARDVDAEVRLTRLRDSVMADVQAEGVVALECVRCLRAYDQAFRAEFDVEYRQVVDVRTGLGLDAETGEDDDTQHINESHELDLGEVLRQETLVSLPMRPDCGAGCPGPDALLGEAETAEPADSRFAALAGLLDEHDADETTEAAARNGRRRDR